VAASKTANGRRLVIVESPAKARKIAEYLGPDFDVEASVGHIRDLPQPSELPPEMKKGPFGRFAVDVDNGFEAYYVVDADKKKKVTELKRALKEADELYLATDEDREGEAIAWHLLQVLQPKIPVHRMVFHEITREAIRRALEQTRELDERLVDAQETRRILDRLYGYEVSPVLWRKVRAGLSAGRVQSVATRLVVERERERMAFRSASYWDITGEFAASDPHAQAGRWFGARLVSLDDHRVATGRDFNDAGQLTSSDVVHLDEEAANVLVRALDGAQVDVRSVEEKPYRRRPAAPFTTSTLQQEAGRKLRFSSRQAMRVAQSLYENGYITYMRTDSTTLSDQAINAARQQARDLYGPEYVPDAPRLYAGKAKNAQEAHEAIRPAGDQRGSTATIRLGARTADGRDAVFGASGTVITFRGFLAAYEEGRDEERHSGDDGERRLPELTVGDLLNARELTADGHTTSPPPRYTEASLVKALEERGIGRPSTYAATIGVIVDRGYVGHKGNALVPTWLAFAVTRLLEEHFGRLVDYDFTAAMEADLDQIAAGEQDRREWLARFYFGDGANGTNGGSPADAPHPPDVMHGLKPLVDDLGDIDARDINSVPLGDGIVLRVGRYGPYLEVPGEDGTARRASVPDEVAPDELTVEKARELLEHQADGDRSLGTDPDTGREIVVRNGRFGPYVTEVLPEDAPKSAKPRTGSLFKSMDPQTVTLDDALGLLSLPRLVGVDPETNEEVTAQNGRYGPYLKRGTDSRSLETEDQIFTVTLDQAKAIYAQPKQRGRRAATPPLRELGPDPETNAPIVIKDGRFGAYATDGTTNATLRKGDEVETITLERAAELLAEKRAAGPRKTAKKAVKKTTKASTTKTAAKKTTTKTAAKKTTAKKTTVKKTTAAKKTTGSAKRTAAAHSE